MQRGQNLDELCQTYQIARVPQFGATHFARTAKHPIFSCLIFFISPKCRQVIDGSEMRSFNCSFPHTAHCLATGEIMISTMGDKEENGKGDFVLIDAKTLKVTGE